MRTESRHEICVEPVVWDVTEVQRLSFWLSTFGSQSWSLEGSRTCHLSCGASSCITTWQGVIWWN